MVGRSNWSVMARAFGIAACALVIGCETSDAPPRAASPSHQTRQDHAFLRMEARKDRARFAQRDTRPYDVLSYDLRGAFDWDADTLKASVAIRVRPLSDLTQLELDSRVEAIDDVTVDGRATTFRTDATNGTLTIALPAASDTRSPREVVIGYRAKKSLALKVSRGRDGDPIGARVVATMSEPLGGSLWFPGNHRPPDRARFRFELTVQGDEDLIANGTRLPVRAAADGKRVVGYETSFDIPTYLMAFAYGDLTHADAEGTAQSSVPISVWYRRGIEIDVTRHLAMLRGQMATFEKLIGPYPFGSYAVVLIPEYFGGEENASISFNDEASGQAAPSFNMNAHELAHQWFGDQVTIETWDDLWVKEGIALILAEEASRTLGDAEGKGRLFGDRFDFVPTDAIRDTSLGQTPDGFDRYTTGPYQRAAWFLTQVRALLGEDVFWSRLRQILHDRGAGAIGTDAFLDIMLAGLDPDVRAQARRSIDVKAGPSLSVVRSPDHPATLRWQLDDPEHVVLTPLEISAVGADGQATIVRLRPNTSAEVSVPEGGYLALDERDVHTPLDTTFALPAATLGNDVAPWLLPRGAALATFEQRSAAAQELALSTARTALEPARFLELYRRLDSDVAKSDALKTGCAWMTEQTEASALRSLWEDVLAMILVADPPTGLFDFYQFSDYVACGVSLPTRVFGDELTALATSQAPGAAARLDYILRFDFGDKRSFDAFAPLATRARNALLRDHALTRLAAQASGTPGYAPVSDGERPRWSALFRDLLARSTAPTWLIAAASGSVGLGDVAALPVLATRMSAVTPPPEVQLMLICSARPLGERDPSAWSQFSASLTSWTDLDAAARQALSDAASCPSP